MNNETEQIFLLNSSETQLSSDSQKIIEVPSVAQVNLENVEDFSTVCRTCATITEYVIPIFEGEGLQNSLADKIHKHLPIQVCPEDALPRAVCYQCAHTLLAWHELVACCEQADAALRTRLAQLDVARACATGQEQQPTTSEEDQSLKHKEQKEFEEIADFVVPLDPSQYESEPSAPVRACDYCNSEHPEPDYKEHLVTAHSDLLFHCVECDTYVDRKDFILHMSLHAVQYASNQDKAQSKEPVKKVRKPKKSKEKDVNENTETSSVKRKEHVITPAVDEPDAEIPSVNYTERNEDRENEFSDHSDAEFNFGPLPESVFQAIEDSQDSQRAEYNEASQADNDDFLPENNDCDVSTESSRSLSDRLSPDKTIKKHKKSRTCPICSKVYTASSSYFYHMKHFHRPSKDHECSVCGRKFGTKGSLKEHASIHTGECKFQCNECGKKFRSNASLYIHEQTHNGVKTFSCSRCQLSFRWSTHLKRHMKRHLAEKAHVCSTCGRGFNIRCDLLRHARTHTAGDFACDKCGVKFAQLRYLKVHMDKKHSAIVPKQSQPAAAAAPQSS